MTQKELDEWVARISYKPGWALRAAMFLHTGLVEITVAFVGPNSCAVGDRVIAHSRIVAPHDFGDFASDMLQAIHELENHETREWYKVDNAQWLKPHDSRAIYMV